MCKLPLPRWKQGSYPVIHIYAYKDGDEYNIFSFLGVSIKLEKESKILLLNQNGLINKILEAVGMS